ncbi:hypothetical protein EST38_g1674 [Candolleomyces aberdarensis]|uniref:PIN domain-containing protein n=1 Tax=Candolleomyces aberdarensis TaxID=2316362 RepID=A0A4Q2DUC6_9AGAR|nr:hypothetical protein EST38_g1674 [Candolleomyces aberdarensis]
MHLEHPPAQERPPRKGKERDPSHPPREAQVTDLDEKIIALRRKNAGAQRTRDKAERERMQPNSAAQSSSTLLSSTAGRTERSPKLSTLPSSSRPAAPSPRKAPGVGSRPVVEADHEEFSRRLKISSSHSPRLSQPSHSKSTPKLYNPDIHPIPTRRTAEPEQLSDTTGSSYVHVSRHPAAQQREDRGGGPRQLFDYRKDDPVRFSVQARPPSSASYTRPIPASKPSGEYISASSTSSYAASVASSTFTLSSTTDGSSASSALFDGRPSQGTEDSGNNVFSKQLKRLYRTITELETKVKNEDANDDMDDGMNGRVLLKGKEVVNTDADKEKWRKQITDHKDLAETIHNLLEISLAPSVPVSLRTIPQKYNIIVRLWTYAFHKLLESLRRASFASPVALENLQDFIYYAYTFYTGLLEEPSLASFKSSWLEALGDLARYKMAVSAMVNSGMGGQGGLTTKAVTEAAEESAKVASKDTLAVPAAGSAKSVSDRPAARIDDSPSPSVGIAAARAMEIEPEKERWRKIAREWYGSGLAEQPGTGKLHHHLGLLSREVESEELRGIYHFTKSMTSLHPFPTSRESVLPIWSLPAQARRGLPDARAPELFVHLHGMLFTNIQMDDFQPTLARFIERLDIEGAEEKEWIMMAIVNIAAILEYGRPSGVLRKLGVVGPKEAAGPQQAAMRVMAKKAAAGVPGAIPPVGDDNTMDVDMQSPSLSSRNPQMTPPSPTSELPDRPPALNYALQLTFSMLSHVLRRPLRQASTYARSTLNPYLTVILTFLSTILKHAPALQVLERSIPWQELAAFFATIPRRVMSSQGLDNPKESVSGERWPMLTSGVSPPIPEDWCMRGMEWVGRKVFERGYWKYGEERKAEMEVLEQVEGVELSDGRIEDDDDDEGVSMKSRPSTTSELERRWTRICRSAVTISGCVDGFTWVAGTREWNVGGKLAEKVEQWKEEDRLDRLEEEARRMGRRWTDDAMEVDEFEGGEISESSESEIEDENDSEEVKALKARRRYLKSLLTSTRQSGSAQPRTKTAKNFSPQALALVPGYTILVVDTNILLSSLSIVTSLIESMKWTIVIPLPVIMELDGLASNVNPQLAEAASSAVSYIATHIRSHSLSLKVQTSKGNYLTNLNVRTEDVDFSESVEKSMDDLILKAAIWQDDHWVDRSNMLKVESLAASQTSNAVKVVFISLDRNLRLKARSRQLAAAGEKELASLMSLTT